MKTLIHNLCSSVLYLCSSVVLISCAGSGVSTSGDTTPAPANPVMGDWQGHVVSDDGTVMPIVAQVVAHADGKYTGVAYPRFDQRMAPWATLQGKTQEGIVTFSGTAANGAVCNGTVSNGEITGTIHGDIEGTFGLRHIVQLSPMLGAKPPRGAIILFDGTSLAPWRSADEGQPSDARWTVRDGIVEVKPGTGSIVTRRKFTDFHLHVEFRTPFMPEADGQARGNSGVYLQGRYEVQVLDSYGLEGEDNECGGVYKVAAPAVNMCAPPGQWQSYDITFRAPRFDGAGHKIEDARLTLLHNGVLIQGDLRIPGPTGGSLDQDVSTPGGIMLQDHGNLVQYRNIWLKESQ
jgi:hypothetical protein